MECCEEQMPMHDGCKTKCRRQCVGQFTENFKVYEVCCREVVKVCPICSFEYEAHIHHMCPRCGDYGHMGYGGGYGQHMGYGYGGGYGHHMGYGYDGGYGHHMGCGYDGGYDGGYGHHMGYGGGHGHHMGYGYGGGHGHHMGHMGHGGMGYKRKDEQSESEEANVTES